MRGSGSKDITASRERPEEQARIRDLLTLLGTGRFALDVGARDGYISRRLADSFEKVVALDLERPPFEHPGVETIAGDVCRLPFSDRHFDAVLCAEVLEHIPPGLLAKACGELARVTAKRLVIGVPYRQDTRLDRTRCQACGARNPPWGHVNQFDESRLRSLVTDLQLDRFSYIGETRQRTNVVSVALMDLAGNPYGTYEQEEGCVACGAPLVRPARGGWLRRGLAKGSITLQRYQSRLMRPRPNWIHAAFVRS